MNTKAHLVIPRDVLEEVDRIAGRRRRSSFIAQATREKLEREKFLRVLEDTGGAWSDSHHPELASDRDIDRYVREKRQSYRRRSRKGRA